jgi:hypothetical protein
MHRRKASAWHAPSPAPYVVLRGSVEIPVTASKQKKPRGSAAEWTIAPERVLQAMGTADADILHRFLSQAVHSLWLPEGMSEEEQNRRIQSAISLMAEIKPRDGVEGMLAVQMVATQEAAMDCMHRAMLPEQTFEGRNMALKHGAKLFAVFLRQLEVLDKHRGKGQQKVTVEHVHVGAGGQAIVGHVEAGGGRQAEAAGAAKTATPSADRPPALTDNPGERLAVSGGAAARAKVKERR